MAEHDRHDGTAKPPPIPRYRLFAWYRLLAFIWIVPCYVVLPFVFPSPVLPWVAALPSVILICWVYPCLEKPSIRKSYTPYSSYISVRYQLIYPVPIFVTLAFSVSAANYFVFGYYITYLDVVLGAVLVGTTVCGVVLALIFCRKVQTKFMEACYDWHICYACGYDLRSFSGNACPECGFFHLNDAYIDDLCKLPQMADKS
ncbi:MAG: hypothetical protein ACPGYV_06775 [Phycisphaeraceae bacterium]